MATGGFSFGANPTPATGGFSFGTGPNQNAAATPSTWLLPGSAAKTTAAGLTLGTPASSVGGGFNFARPITPSNATQAGLFSALANPASSSSSGSIPLGNQSLQAPGGFNLGGITTSALGSLNTGGGGATATTQGTGFGLIGTNQTTSSGLQLGSTPQTSTFSFGLNSNAPASSTFSFGTGLGGAKTTAPTLSLGAAGGTLPGLFGMQPTASAAATSASGGLFGTAASSQPSLGLGGVAVTSGGPGSSAGKASESKTLKETELPPVVAGAVELFQKHVKEEKVVQEDIARMSNKAVLKAQEDVTALRQLLAVVSNGLQRNACAVEKLKRDMTRELKNAEMAQRTKDIPDGLQYENTAPTLYFQELLENFEARMQTYRQQIENLENHLAALHQPARHSPAELIALMKKLHETFIVLAAQLQQVHESVNNQKEQYKTYRKIFHGDSKNIFERQTKPAPKPSAPRSLDLAGPSPFSGITNAAATAMASILNRSQQPAGAPPVAGLGSGTLGGTGSSLSQSVMGPAFPNPSAGLSGGGLNLFGSSSTALPTTASTGLGTGLGAGLGVGLFPTQPAASVLPNPQNLSAGTNRPFQLNKPPTTAKRGRR